MTVRRATREDEAAIGAIAEAADLFPAAYLAEMFRPAFEGAAEIWCVADGESAIDGFAYARHEMLTDRTWNLLALATRAEARGRGIGAALLATMETETDARVMIIETTQRPEQAAARALYQRHGYAEAGRIADFYGAGEDKITFAKALA